jgi:hypothetical protein
LKKIDSKVHLLSLCFEQSQALLASQASAAFGADSRAMSFCGACLAAASLLVGLASVASTTNVVFLVLGAICEISAAIIAAYAARPRNFYFPGAQPDDLRSDIAGQRDLPEVLKELIDFSQKHIDINRIIIRENARNFVRSAVTAILGIILTASPYLTRTVCYLMNLFGVAGGVLNP